MQSVKVLRMDRYVQPSQPNIKKNRREHSYCLKMYKWDKKIFEYFFLFLPFFIKNLFVYNFPAIRTYYDYC